MPALPFILPSKFRSLIRSLIRVDDLDSAGNYFFVFWTFIGLYFKDSNFFVKSFIEYIDKIKNHIYNIVSTHRLRVLTKIQAKELLVMTGLIPFNRRNRGLALADTGFEDFYNMLDSFFSDSSLSDRNLLRDTFKIDIQETESEYRIEAELPGIKKEEINLDAEGDSLLISVNREEAVNKDNENYIHRERRSSSMSRRIRLANAKLAESKAKLEEGILTVTVPKVEKENSSLKIDIE